jgi:adenylate cyclase
LRQHIVRIALGLAIVLAFLGHAARLYQVGFITQLDNIIYDARLRLTMPGTVDQRIVILDIDEKSLAVPELGRWPWGRDRIAHLIDKLFDKYGLAVLGFDVVFAEPDESSGLKVLDQLARKELRDITQFRSVLDTLRPRLDNDAAFARAIRGRPVVLGYYFSNAEDALESGALPEPVLPLGTFSGRNITFTSWRGYGSNLPGLMQNAASAGHFNPFVDPDGVSRRVPMLAEYKGQYYEALSLAMVRMLVGLQAADDGKAKDVKLPGVVPGFSTDSSVVSRDYSGLEWLEVGPVKVPVDDTVSAWIPYRGGRGSYPYISLADVYFDKVPVERLRGKVALVGTSAPGLLDLRSTPVGEVYPGVEIHANMIAGMLDRNIKLKPAYMVGAEVILLIVGGVTLALLLPFLGPLKATLVSLVAIVLVAGLNLAIWSGADMMLPLASSLLMTAFLFALNMSYGYFVESRSKRQFTELFGQYVPPELVDKMAEDPQKYNMEPKNAELTILFSDVRGFTSISEALKPDELREYINDYLTDMSGIIRSSYKGTLDKYIGDAIMAFWGAPVDDAQHARNGVLAALAMQKECKSLNERFASRGWPQLKIGIGVNSGNVRVGDMGSQIRRAYTVMGDAVNVASRLEARTKYYGVGILVGEATKALVKEVVFKEVDKVKVKGKEEALTIYEPIGVEGEVDQKTLDELKLWAQTLRAYRGQQWDQAEMNLLNLQRMNPNCYLYEHYAAQIAEKRRNPVPVDWDGVTAFDEK